LAGSASLHILANYNLPLNRALCTKENMAYFDILIFIIPSLFLLVFSLWNIKSGKPKNNIFYVWLVVLAILLIIGASVWESDNEATQLASALFLSSSVWLTGPFLVWTSTKLWHKLIYSLVVFILSITSTYICFFVLAYSGQIWGM
jgi:hypothetical protein